MNLPAAHPPERTAPTGWRALLLVEPGELVPLLSACGLTFFTFSSYFILRPIRDAIQSEQHLKTELPWVVTATLVMMLVCNAAFSFVASRSPRRWILPVAFQFFVAIIVLFYVLFTWTDGAVAARVAQAFYVWISVFNLLAISTAWSVLADAFTVEQSRRLFARISIGATAGAMSGAAITKLLVEHIGPNHLLLVSAGFLEVAMVLGWYVSRRAATGQATVEGAAGPAPDAPIGGGILDGVRAVVTNPYLLLIALYILLYTITSTFLSLQQARIMKELFDEETVENARSLRTAFSANITFVSNLIVLGTQIFLTAHVVRFLGVGRTLFVTPIVTVAAFALLGVQESARSLLVAMVARSSLHYAIDKPSREALFSPLDRDAKYKAKNLIDTFIYRGGDTMATWMMAFVPGGAILTATTLVAALTWTAISWPLGLAYERRAAARAGEPR
jgi:AAA family ATP:ADP antiporter